MVTLINNAVQKALSTLSRAKAYLEISGDSKDTIVTLALNHATDAIEGFCKRHFLRQTYTNEIYDGSGGDTLVLRNWPVSSVSSLQVNTSGDSTESWNTIESSRYHVYEDGRIVLAGGRANFSAGDSPNFIDAPKKYRVTYVAGYLIDFDQENTVASHTLPAELEYACLKLTSAIVNTRKNEGLQNVRVGDLSMSFRSDIMTDPELKEILTKHQAITL